MSYVIRVFDKETKRDKGFYSEFSKDKVSPEYPDATLFEDENDAINAARRLIDEQEGIGCTVWVDYGLEDEETIETIDSRWDNRKRRTLTTRTGSAFCYLKDFADDSGTVSPGPTGQRGETPLTPRGKTPMALIPDIYHFMDCSTAHIMRADADKLSECADRESPGFAKLVVYEYDEGFFVYCRGDYEVHRGHFSNLLMDLLKIANQHDCTFLRLDADGRVYEELPRGEGW